MSQTAIQEIRPWDRPFWKPARGKVVVLTYLVLIHVLAVIGLILFPLSRLCSSWTTRPARQLSL